VDEDGVEAAAVTAIRSRSAPRPVRDPPKLVLVDHAFQFFIVDQDLVLFEGYVADPNPAPDQTTADKNTDTITASAVDHAKAAYWQDNFGVVPIGLEATIDADGTCADT
jgi:Serpin (serine protease inhibitor)